MNLVKYRSSEAECARTTDLMRIMPAGWQSVLEIGARDGHFSRLLTDHFSIVTALDLEEPDLNIPGVVTAQGDVRELDFPDESFDCVVCTEVLEHIPDLQHAADEISRVVRGEVVIGVPYRQDTRLARTTCRSCGQINPPWGHVNTFDEKKLVALFPRLDLVSTSFVWTNLEWTNPISTCLMDLAGNPWGTYDQEEPCIHCGARLVPPNSQSFSQRMLAAMAYRLQRLQSTWSPARPNWIHVVFRKR